MSDFDNYDPTEDNTFAANVELVQRAKKDSLYNVLKRNYETLLRNGDYSAHKGYFDKALEHLASSEMLVESLNDPILKEFETVWITLTPEQCHFDDKPHEFVSTIKKWLDKAKHVNEYMFSIEQRSEDPNTPHGIHAHIVLKRVDLQTHSRYVEWVKRTWSKFHGTNFKFYGKNKTGAIYFKNAEFYEEKKEYILGKKEGSHKQALVDADVIYRQQVGLQPFYTN